jgi:hypothetical protein
MAVMQISINDTDITQQENAKEETEPKEDPKPKEEPKKPIITTAPSPSPMQQQLPSNNSSKFGNLFGGNKK